MNSPEKTATAAAHPPSLHRAAWKLVIADPLLICLELIWRWVFGLAALGILFLCAAQLRDAFALSGADELALGSGDPMQQAEALSRVLIAAMPHVARIAAFATPALVLIWVVVSAVGRHLIFRRLQSSLSGQSFARDTNSAPGVATMLILQFSRAFLLLIPLSGYIAASLVVRSLVGAADPSSSVEQRLAIAVLLFLALVVASIAVWMLTHFVAALAPSIALLRGSRALDSLALAAQSSIASARTYFGIAAQNGLLRTLVAVLITLLSLVAIPIARVSPGMSVAFIAALTVAYCVVSDFLLLVRTAAYTLVAAESLEGASANAESQHAELPATNSERTNSPS